MQAFSRPPSKLCDHILTAIAHVCVTDSDLEQLGIWGEEPSACPLSRQTWSRAALRTLCRHTPTGERLADLLDLRYASQVMQIRSEDAGRIDARLAEVLRCNDGESLPGLLWATSTDPRPCVYKLAGCFASEIMLIACRSLVDPAFTGLTHP